MNILAKPELKSLDQAIRETIYRACLLLDEEKFLDWLSLCAADFNYRITTYSPEIRRQMTWYEQDAAGLRAMVEMLPKHNTDHGRLTRHVSVYTVEAEGSQSEAKAISSFACYRTMLDGINSHIDSGETQLFLIGKYHDRFRIDDDGPRFVERNVLLDTRRLDKGSHYPI
ncbi:MAG TPA: aromatic-ring-hydroxylating dioxygenase subunit beta [Xanthobacteraceae bacterium]|jgi:methanesulfonate monooxygenase small subunit